MTIENTQAEPAVAEAVSKPAETSLLGGAADKPADTLTTDTVNVKAETVTVTSAAKPVESESHMPFSLRSSTRYVWFAVAFVTALSLMFLAGSFAGQAHSDRERFDSLIAQRNAAIKRADDSAIDVAVAKTVADDLSKYCVINRSPAVSFDRNKKH